MSTSRRSKGARAAYGPTAETEPGAAEGSTAAAGRGCNAHGIGKELQRRRGDDFEAYAMNHKAGFWVRSDVAEAMSFYDQHYDIIVKHFLKPQKKEAPLEFSLGQVCRFCGKRSPEVSFRLEAHAIPEALGNKTLLSAYECDTCNKRFGDGIENDLGNWSKPIRALARIRGKKRVLTLKKGSSGGWRIDAGPAGLDIKAYEGDAIVAVDETAKTVTFRLTRDPYTPLAVLKAFVKVGLTILPEKEICHFQHALRWIQENDHTKSQWKFPVLYTFQPGPLPNDLLVASILRRKPDAENVPYAFLILSYGNEVFQIMIPTPEKDRGLAQSPITLMQFPVTLDIVNNTPHTPWRTEIDLSGHQIVKGEAANFTMAFENVSHRRIPKNASSETS